MKHPLHTFNRYRTEKDTCRKLRNFTEVRFYREAYEMYSDVDSSFFYYDEDLNKFKQTILAFEGLPCWRIE